MLKTFGAGRATIARTQQLFHIGKQFGDRISNTDGITGAAGQIVVKIYIDERGFRTSSQAVTGNQLGELDIKLFAGGKAKSLR